MGKCLLRLEQNSEINVENDSTTKELAKLQDFYCCVITSLAMRNGHRRVCICGHRSRVCTLRCFDSSQFCFCFQFYANCSTYRMILTYNIRIFICLNYNTPYVNASVLHCVTFIICTMVGPQVSTSDQGSNLLGNAQIHNGKHSLP